MYYTLNEISYKYKIGYRSLETNLAKMKPNYKDSKLLFFNGQNWQVDETLLKEITNRKFAKHLVEFDCFKKVDAIQLKNLIKESELKTFLTVAPRGVTSLLKIKDIVKDTFDFLEQQNTTNEPTFFVYSIESNSNYFKESNKDFKLTYHIHAVSNVQYNVKQESELTTILQEQINAYIIHDIHTVKVSPYVANIGEGGYKYTLKMNEYTGAFIK